MVSEKHRFGNANAFNFVSRRIERPLSFCSYTLERMTNDDVLYVTKESAEWWRQAVIYQIYPRSFADGNGDGMGDLQGVTQRLESLQELGIDAIWFSPFFKSPQKDAGYDVSDYKDIDPLFGTLADFDALLARAHSLGLRGVSRENT